MDFNNYNAILAPIGVIGTVATAWYSVLEVRKQLRKAKQAAAEEILREAQEQTDLVKLQLEAKINNLELEVHNLKENVDKDLSNLKESHSVELKNLGEKIELLREELRDQSSGILVLLTKLVDK